MITFSCNKKAIVSFLGDIYETSKQGNKFVGEDPQSSCCVCLIVETWVM